MNGFRGRFAAVVAAVATAVVSAPWVARWASAQPPGAEVLHIGLSKNLSAEVIKIEPIKHYTCKDVVSKAVRKMWTAPARFTLKVGVDEGCDELPGLFGGTLAVAWTVTVREDAILFGTHDGTFTWSAGASTARGTMNGTWGCGTHRAPLATCERCRDPNHIEGLLVGDVTAGPLKGAKIRATYAGAIKPLQVTPTVFPGSLQMTLDGVYIQTCP